MKLLDQVDLVARRRGLSRATRDNYSLWIKRFLVHAQQKHREWKHPTQLGTADVEEFLNHLVGEKNLSASSQNQALNALVFHPRSEGAVGL